MRAYFVDTNHLRCDIPPPTSEIDRISHSIVVHSNGNSSQYLVDGYPYRILNLLRGVTYYFTVGGMSANDALPHLSTEYDGSLQNETLWTSGSTRNGTTLTFTVPQNSPDTLYLYDPSSFPEAGGLVFLIISDRTELVDVRVSDDGGITYSDTLATFRYTGRPLHMIFINVCFCCDLSQ